MNPARYQKAFDGLSFSADFQARTVSLLRQRARESEKEKKPMKSRLFRKPAVLVAAATLLVLSVSAATLLLSPAQVAERYQQPALADAFDSGDALLLNQRVETEDYAVTLLGLTTGEALTTWEQTAEAAHTYAVVALDRLDGAPLEQQTFPFTDYTLTPLVAGYAPWRLNNWSLHSFATGFSDGGTFYFLLDTQDLEMFADHTVYLAFYEGGVPSSESFAVAEDGAIAFADGFEGPRALFTLPLDAGKANPDAVAAFFESSGLGADFFAPAQDNASAVSQEPRQEEPTLIQLVPQER